MVYFERSSNYISSSGTVVERVSVALQTTNLKTRTRDGTVFIASMPLIKRYLSMTVEVEIVSAYGLVDKTTERSDHPIVKSTSL